MIRVVDPAEYTDPYLETYTQVPKAGPGVCRVCHGGPNDDYAICFSCGHTMSQVTFPTELVVPISLIGFQASCITCYEITRTAPRLQFCGIRSQRRWLASWDYIEVALNAL